MWNFKNKQSTQSKMKTSNKRPVLLAAMLGFLFAYPAIQTNAHEDGVDTHSDSIKVHGDWVVSVTNPDGSVAQERRFRNALVGPKLLVSLITNLAIDPVERIGMVLPNESLDGSFSWRIPVTASGVNAAAECQSVLQNNRVQPDAVVSSASFSAFTLTRNLTLPVSCVSAASYSINSVATAILVFVITSEDGSGDGSTLVFTEKTLDAPITGILADQVVTLKATISFQ